MKRCIAMLAALALTGAAHQGVAAEPAGLSGSVPAGVVRATLPNGLRVVVVPDPLAPVVTTELNYLAGSNDAPDGFPGMAHALEHMMFRGSEGLDKQQLAELGALMGGINNANTTETVTQYTYTVPAEDLGLVLHVEALRMHGLSLNQSDWEKERGAIEQEVSRDLSSPFYNYISQAQALLFAGTPYQHDALGTRPSFDRTDAAMLRQFYERWYAPNNAILVVAGDVRPEAALAQVRAAFADVPSRTVPDHPTITLNPVQAKTLELPTNFPVGLVSLAYRMPGLKAADFAAADILGDVLGSERGALYGLVPAGKALLAEFAYEPKRDVGFGVAIAAFPTGGDPAPLLADMRRVLGDAVQHGVPPELVEAAKRQELAQLAFANDSIEGLAKSWSRALADQGANSPDDLAHAYAAVTVDDVNRLAKLLLDPQREITAILTPVPSGVPGASSGYGGGESFASPPDHPVTLPDWAASALASLQLPPETEAPDATVLPNGLRLIVQPEHVSHTVSVFGRIRQVRETQEPPGKEGVAALTGQLFSYGTETLDRLALRKAVDDMGADLSAGPGFSLRVLTPQFEPGMRLLAENELHPAFPSAAFAVVRGQFAKIVSGELQSPDYRFERATNRAVVPAGDPSLREATPETVTAVQLSDLLAFHAAAYRPDLATIVVVGDVTPEQARGVVAQTFGAWQASGPTPAIDLPPVGPSPPTQARVIDPSSVQDRVTLTESIGLPVTDLQRYRLILGNVVLGEGFASRLYRDLRVRTGYVYSVSSNFEWSRTRGDYTVSFGADAENVEKSRELVLGDLKAMQSAPVTDAELSRAKADMLRRLPMQRASVNAIAGRYLQLAELDLPLLSTRTIAERFMGVTAEQIRQAFTDWVRPDDLSEVVKGPARQE